KTGRTSPGSRGTVLGTVWDSAQGQLAPPQLLEIVAQGTAGPVGTVFRELSRMPPCVSDEDEPAPGARLPRLALHRDADLPQHGREASELRRHGLGALGPELVAGLLLPHHARQRVQEVARCRLDLTVSVVNRPYPAHVLHERLGNDVALQGDVRRLVDVAAVRHHEGALRLVCRLAG